MSYFYEKFLTKVFNENKKSNQYSDNNQLYDEIEYALFCNALEKQYKQEDGIFEILRVIELDKEHSDRNAVQAVDYFNE